MDGLREKLAQAVKMIEQTGKTYASARAVSWLLQEQRKIVLAEEARKADGSSMAERENRARGSEAYRIHLAGTSDAIKQELTAKAEYERWQAQWESIRSLISFEKKQMEVFKED